MVYLNISKKPQSIFLLHIDLRLVMIILDITQMSEYHRGRLVPLHYSRQNILFVYFHTPFIRIVLFIEVKKKMECDLFIMTVVHLWLFQIIGTIFRVLPWHSNALDYEIISQDLYCFFIDQFMESLKQILIQFEKGMWYLLQFVKNLYFSWSLTFLEFLLLGSIIFGMFILKVGCTFQKLSSPCIFKSFYLLFHHFDLYVHFDCFSCIANRRRQAPPRNERQSAVCTIL